MVSTKYRDIEVRVSGVRLSPTRTKVSCRNFELFVDKLGGEAPSPLDLTLASLIGCLNITATLVARDMGIGIDDASFEAVGIFNPSVFYGKGGPRAGYREVKVLVRLKTNADEEKLKEFIRR
ncbi:MAG: OsmC family protein, partial [Candidatus Korarchaeum sp.]|nr:OsmC family protein [Candidatus Korarchaeum sp.]MDW8034960.1 OsmC family protein [Candidatus Korarchaeum sp.]